MTGEPTKPIVFGKPLQERCEQLIHRIRPGPQSECRRQNIVSHLHSIVTSCFPNATAMPFGSVPLRTYLPDGDIDLSIFCPDPLKDGWAPKLHARLEEEQRNAHAPFKIGDVQVINAEVFHHSHARAICRQADRASLSSIWSMSTGYRLLLLDRLTQCTFHFAAGQAAEMPGG